MDALSYITLFIFGLLIGSFLNVVILRFDTGKSIAKGRSACFSCGKPLSWFELIPLASFMIQRGRCRGCKSRISWQYPLVELLSALAFPLAFSRATGFLDGPLSLAAFMLIAAILSLYIVIAAYDLRHKIIPDGFSYAAAGAALGLMAVEWMATGSFPMYKLAAGIVFFLFFWSFWYFSKGRWMGFGDAKLALSVGFFLGLSQGSAALLLSFWIGAVCSLAIMLLQKTGMFRGRLGLKSEIPFGPFILIGFLISFAWGIDMQSILFFLTV